MTDKLPSRAVKAKSIDLGIRLNHLLDRTTQLGQSKAKVRGLVLPTPTDSVSSSGDQIGSGLVVIVGEPGSGKSTLALQIAVAAAQTGCDSAYVSLEEEPERIVKKARIFRWKRYLSSLTTPLDFLTDSAGKVQHSDPLLLRKLLMRCRGKRKREGRIVLPTLAPRPLAHDGPRMTSFFWEQYRQIEFLVRSAADHHALALNDKADPTGIRLIVIDSLNMLGVESENREMLHRVFDLFRRNRILGVFTAEKNSPLGFDSTLGDVILNFSRMEDAGYEVTLLECSKSRFSSRTLGRHPYKIKSPQNSGGGRGEVGIVVLPSPHAVVAATNPTIPDQHQNQKATFPFGWGDQITGHLLRSTLHRGEAVAIAGPGATFKSQVALNFLLHGLAAGESVLYLRLGTPEPKEIGHHMRPFDEPVGPPDDEKLAEERSSRKKVLQILKELAPDPIEPELKRIEIPRKIDICVQRAASSAAQLVLVDFRTGMLQPEEFIDTIRRIFEVNEGIKRVVVDDVGAIGVSYPLLKHSLTTGDLFLSALVHLIKNYGMDLLLVGTTGDYPDANHMVHQACTLADAVLRTSVGAIFGDKYVLLTGDGMTNQRPNEGDTPPVVLVPETNDKIPTLKPNVQMLDEFVGFDSGSIHRPGIVLHMYEENPLHRRYNSELAARLQNRYGTAGVAVDGAAAGVRLIAFKPGGLPPLESSQDAEDRPRDHTSVRMVDEFEPVGPMGPDGAGEPPLYLRNVLLMACRSGARSVQDQRTWEGVLAEVEKPANASESQSDARRVWFDRVAPETLACLVLEGITTGGGLLWDNGTAALPLSVDSEVRTTVAKELSAINRLLMRQERVPVAGTSDPNENGLRDDADVYVCWYSQLRELVARTPELADKLTVCSLPGGGFTGDWRLRVEPGSVSLRLGKSIVANLVSAAEDYERTLAGLGLPPAEKVWFSPLPPWIGARTETLSRLMEIYKNAHRRSQIKDYRRFNRALYAVGNTLASQEMTLSEIEGLMQDLSSMVSALSR